MLAVRAVTAVSPSGSVTRLLVPANSNLPRGTWRLPGELPAPVAEAAGRGLLAGALLTMLEAWAIVAAFDLWAQWAYPGTDDGGVYFVPLGMVPLEDGGPHAASTGFHFNELPRDAWLSSNLGATHPLLGIHGHGQAATGAVSSHRWWTYQEGDRIPPNPSRWYNRVHLENVLGSSAPALVSSQPWRVPAQRLWPDPMAFEWLYPSLDPFRLPIGQPVPVPRPRPFRFPAFPAVDPLGDPDPRVVPKPRVRPRPVRRPHYKPGTVSVPAVEVVPDPVTGRPALQPAFHPLERDGSGRGRRPPKKRVGGAVGHAVFWLANLVTESLDLLNAMWWALPKNRRTPWADPQRKAFDLVSFWADPRGGFDAWSNAAVENAVLNQLEDHAIGRLTRAANHYVVNSGYYHSVVGVTAGPVM